MARVLLENLCKTFDGTVVVRDINLEIKDKEFVVLVGPSGCGKSTTLRMIAGLEEPSGGEIYLGDKPVTDLAIKDRNIAMVFQNYALYPHMNVYKNMAFGLKMRGVPKDEIDELVSRAAAILNIESLLGRRPRQLSGGQRQRVALGRAIVRDPDVFLLDEPLSNLDAKLRVQMRGEIVKLRNRLEATMVYVTHDQVEAMSMGDRIVVMLDGEIQQVGAPLDVYKNPVNTFVATFVGNRSMNLFDAVLVGDGDAPAVRIGATTITLPARFRAAAPKLGATVRLGIRPEHLGLGSAIASGQATALSATVEVAEPLGSTLVLEANSAAGNFVAEVGPDETVRSGDGIEMWLDTEKMHLFDSSTGRNLLAA